MIITNSLLVNLRESIIGVYYYLLLTMNAFCSHYEYINISCEQQDECGDSNEYIDFLPTFKVEGFHVNTNRRHTDSHGITMMKLTHHAGFASTHQPHQLKNMSQIGLTMLHPAQSAPSALHLILNHPDSPHDSTMQPRITSCSHSR